MPKVSGDDFFEVIKTKYPETKVLIASNFDIDDQEVRVFAADDYHDKSDGNEVLLEKIEKLFEKSEVLKGGEK